MDEMQEHKCKITGTRRRKSLPKDVRRKVYEIHDGHCAYCGKEIDIKDMQVDHIQSVYLGGADEIANYRPACRSCNFYKSTMSIERLREELGRIARAARKAIHFSSCHCVWIDRVYGQAHQILFRGNG